MRRIAQSSCYQDIIPVNRFTSYKKKAILTKSDEVVSVKCQFTNKKYLGIIFNDSGEQIIKVIGLPNLFNEPYVNFLYSDLKKNPAFKIYKICKVLD